jgi:hypothetical protein
MREMFYSVLIAYVICDYLLRSQNNLALVIGLVGVLIIVLIGENRK